MKTIFLRIERVRNAVTHTIRYSKATYTRSVFQENIKGPKQFWKQVKKCYPTKSSKEQNNQVFQINGEHISNTKILSNKFCDFFTTIGKRLQNTLPIIGHQTWKHHDHLSWDYKQNLKSATFCFERTSYKEIRNILVKLKRN